MASARSSTTAILGFLFIFRSFSFIYLVSGCAEYSKNSIDIPPVCNYPFKQLEVAMSDWDDDLFGDDDTLEDDDFDEDDEDDFDEDEEFEDAYDAPDVSDYEDYDYQDDDEDEEDEEDDLMGDGFYYDDEYSDDNQDEDY